MNTFVPRVLLSVGRRTTLRNGAPRNLLRGALHRRTLGTRQQGRWGFNAEMLSKATGLATFAAAGSLLVISDQLFDQYTRDAIAHQDDLPVFTREDVAKHDNREDGFWVTYGDDVFDITDFIEQHPGGDRILAGVGGPVDGYWGMYKQHQTPAVLEILMKYKIGKLDQADVPKIDMSDPYANDPKRSSVLKPHTTTPFNCETIKRLIPDHFLTPNDIWYTRHHHPVPDIPEAEYKLQIESNNGNTLEVSVEDLKQMFPKVETVITLQCAGNRRAVYDAHGKTQGLKWDVGAISTAKWGGVRLKDVLEALQFDKASAEHVQFTGGDRFGETVYDASIPIHKAISEYGDVLLAFEMNGEPIPREHGAPLRVLVPGHLAARSVKWVNKIRVSHEEAYSTWQRSYAYKSMGNQPSFKGVDPTKLHSVQELPVQSAICRTEASVKSSDEEIFVEGYAWSGGGRGIIRVCVSADGGETWTEAELKEGSEQPKHRAWAWTLWEAAVPLPENKGDNVQLCVRAVDASCNQQPKDCKDIWNLRGILNNSWHCVDVPVEQEGESADTK